MTEVRSAHHSNAYNIFILVLTLQSLLIMLLLLLPLDETRCRPSGRSTTASA